MKRRPPQRAGGRDKPTQNKTKWSISEEAAIDRMEAEIRKHLDRMVADSSVVDGAWTTWYIAHEPDYEVGKYFITPREFDRPTRFPCRSR